METPQLEFQLDGIFCFPNTPRMTWKPTQPPPKSAPVFPPGDKAGRAPRSRMNVAIPVIHLCAFISSVEEFYSFISKIWYLKLSSLFSSFIPHFGPRYYFYLPGRQQ